MSLPNTPVINPPIPYTGPIQGGLGPNKFIRIIGHPTDTEFFCILQCGPNNFDDIALQLSVQLDGTIFLNSQVYGALSEKQCFTTSQFVRGQQFDIVINCEATVFKIELNGDLCEYSHQLACHRISHIRIEGGVFVSQISFENQPTALISSAGINDPPPPYPAGAVPTPFIQQQPQHQQQQRPNLNNQQYPLNSRPQAIVYSANNPERTVTSPSDPFIQQTAATSRPYNPFFIQSGGRIRFGDRKTACIVIGLIVGGFVLFLTIFLVVFFIAINTTSKIHEDILKNFNKH